MGSAIPKVYGESSKSKVPPYVTALVVLLNTTMTVWCSMSQSNSSCHTAVVMLTAAPFFTPHPCSCADGYCSDHLKFLSTKCPNLHCTNVYVLSFSETVFPLGHLATARISSCLATTVNLNGGKVLLAQCEQYRSKRTIAITDPTSHKPSLFQMPLEWSCHEVRASKTNTWRTNEEDESNTADSPV